MLFLEVAPQAALISTLVVFLVALISCISAKRFNFLHGTIVFFTLLSLLAGVDQILISKGLVETNAIAKNVSDHLSIISTMMLPVYDGILGFLKGQSFYASIEKFVGYIYFAPVVLWLVSRFFAGIFRRKKSIYQN